MQKYTKHFLKQLPSFISGFNIFCCAYIGGLLIFYSQEKLNLTKTTTIALFAIAIAFLIWYKSKNHRYKIYWNYCINLSAGFAISQILGLFANQDYINRLNDDRDNFFHLVYKQDLNLTGEIISLITTKNKAGQVPIMKFTFKVNEVKPVTLTNKTSNALIEQALLGRNLNLSIYKYQNLKLHKNLGPGTKLNLYARIKRPNSWFNKFGFKYETYAHTNKIFATGYILNKKGINILKQNLHHNKIRQNLANQVSKLNKDKQIQGLNKSLLTGSRSDLDASLMQLFINTNTAHLFAISGLHFSILGFWGFLFFCFLWNMITKYTLTKESVIFTRFTRINRFQFALTGALLFSSVYLVLSGMGIPSIRAWILIAIPLIFLYSARKYQAFNALTFAAILILLFNPQAIISASFWLSFIAVAILILAAKMFNNFHSKSLSTNNLQNAWRKFNLFWLVFIITQIYLSITLMPIIATLFHYISHPIISIMANMVAIPTISFIILPSAFIAHLMSYVSLTIAELINQITLISWQALLSYLNLLNNWSDATWLSRIFIYLSPINTFVIYITILLVVICMKVYNYHPNKNPKKIWSTHIVVLALIIVISFTLHYHNIAQTKLRGKQVLVNIFDVGQGQAVLIVTKNHAILYDTGPSFSKTFNAANIIKPTLNSLGKNKFDLILISHSDNDHASAVQNLLEIMPNNKKILVGDPNKFQKKFKKNFSRCHTKQEFVFDGVLFKILHPKLEQTIKKANNNSCVLLIDNGKQKMLITGDLENKYERQLMQNKQTKNIIKNITVFMLGHHGSKSSNSKKFLEYMQPQLALVSSGYQNRYGFPKQKIINRLEKMNIPYFNTANKGEISFILDDKYHVEQNNALTVQDIQFGRTQKLFFQR